MRLVFFLEERSMKTFLEEFLPRHFPRLEFLCVAHEGKQDLEKSLRRKLPAWKIPSDRFVVVRDNDGSDCLALKSRLSNICQEAGVEALVRIACQELESWYLGDPRGLAAAFHDDKILQHAEKKKFRDPDRLGSPFREIQTLLPSFQKTSGARALGQAMSIDGNRSRSFQVFVKGLRQLCE